jgi:hypothetical protein
MVGVLAVSFCDRREGQAGVCLDLWSYPDGTYNLVMENFGKEGEFAFACALHQLAAPLKGNSFTAQNEVGVLQIERCSDQVCAEFVPFDLSQTFRHCIAADEYRMAIEALEANAVGYLA